MAIEDNDPAPGAAAATTGPALPRTIATVRLASPGRVIGDLAISAGQRGTDGTIHLGTLIDFANDLVRAGAGSRAHAAGLTTAFLNPCFGPRLHGEAVLANEAPPLAAWQVLLSERDGRAVAGLTLTVLIAGAPAAGDSRTTPVSTAERPPRPAEDRAEARRAQIAVAACDVIARKGFAAASMREIAKAAGLQVPTMYQYVGSKDEVLELVYSRAMREVRADLAAATSGASTSLGKLTAAIRALTANGDRLRRQIGVLNRELKSLPKNARLRVLEEYKDFLGELAALIREGVASGEFRRVEPEIAANLIEAACDVWPLRQFAVGPYGVATFRAEVEHFLLAALAMPAQHTAG